MDASLDQEIRGRVMRLAELRRAGRALAGCQLHPPFHDEEARVVRRTLEGVASGEYGTDRLRSVDAVLERMRAGIVETIDGTGFAQFRAVMPGVAATYREEVLALLDVALEVVEDGASRLRLVEYLVTLLSAQHLDGEWRSGCEPSSLTARLGQVCERIRAAFDGSVEEVVEQLDEASVDVQIADNVQPVLRDVRALKESLGERILVPGILRRVVAYNLDVWNRRSQRLEDERTQQRLEEALIDAGEDPITLGTGAFLVQAAASQAAQGLETQRQQALTSAQRRERETAHDALAERVVGALAAELAGKPVELDLEPLGTSDLLESLVEPEQRALVASPEPPQAATIRLMIAAQVLLQADDALLETLGADPAFLRSQWLRRLHERTRSATNDSIAAGQLGVARELADVKELRVGAAISQLLRDGRRPRLVERGGEAVDDSPHRNVLIIFFEDHRTRAAAVLLALLLAGLGAWRVSMSTSRTQDLLSPREISLVSPHLTSGYRDGKSGHLFIGRVDDKFAKMPAEHRQREGWGIALQLQRSFDVREVILYDEELSTAFHSVGGEIRVPVLYEDD